MTPKDYVIFLLWFQGFTFGLPLLIFLIRYATGFDLMTSIIVILPMALASTLAGARFARRNRTAPDNLEMWVMTMHLTMLALATNLLVILLVMTFAPEVTGQLTVPIVFGVALFAFVIYWLIGRVSFGIAAKSHAKKMAGER